MKPITALPLTSSKKPGILIDRNFALLWLGGTISTFGDFICGTTLVIWITLVLAKGQTWAPLAVSGIPVAIAIPLLSVGPIAGVFVDRWDKRRTMLLMDALRTVFTTILVLSATPIFWSFFPASHLSLIGQLGLVYAIIFLNSICSQFFTPARFALIGDIVESPYRTQASSMTQTSMIVAMLIAPALGPILFLATGATWALAINAFSFLISFLALWALRVPETTEKQTQAHNFFQDFRAGLDFARHNHTISTLLITVAIVMFGASALNALDIFFALDNLHTPANLYGLLATALGIGSLLGAILTGKIVAKIGLIKIFVISLLLTGIGILIYSRMSMFVPGLLILMTFGIFQTSMNVTVSPLIMLVTPQAYMGRISAILNPIVGLVGLLGTAVAGYLASNILQNFHMTALGINFGTFDTIFTGSGILIIIGAIYALSHLGFTDPAPQPDNQ
jgi:MFS family permease